MCFHCWACLLKCSTSMSYMLQSRVRKCWRFVGALAPCQHHEFEPTCIMYISRFVGLCPCQLCKSWHEKAVLIYSNSLLRHCIAARTISVLPPGGEAGSSEAGSHDPALLAYKDCRWQNTAVQQCLQLCSSVDLVYKLLIQDIQPVLGESCYTYCLWKEHNIKCMMSL